MGLIEQPRNASEKTLACLVLDRSGSMTGAPIQELNNGIKSFLSEIQNDSLLAGRLEVCIIEFDDKINITHQPSLAENINFTDIKEGGTTAMVNAVREAIKVVEARKAYYKSTNTAYKLPWIILLTDGAPDSDQDVAGLKAEVEQLTKAQKFMFLPIGVAGADMAVLNQIAGYKKVNGNFMKQPALGLAGTKFVDFFEWLSASMSAIASAGEGAPITAPSPDEWMVFPTS